MNVLIYDLEVFQSGIRYPIKDAFEKNGHFADMFDWGYYLPSYPHPDLINRIRTKFFIKNYTDKINKHLQWIIKHGKYDMLLVLTGKHLYPETIQLAAKYIPFVANWNTDDLFNPLNSSSWTIDSIPLYDAHFTPRPHLEKEYKKYGAKQFISLDWYYRSGLLCAEDSIPKDKEFDISFVGAWSQRRSQFIKPLLSKRTQVFGWGWRKNENSIINNNNYQPSISMIEMMKVFQKTKININILTIENRDSNNLRNFEIPAAKGFQISERSESVSRLFEEDKEIVLFSDAAELTSKVNYYLNNDFEREKIANRGYLRLIHGKNSLTDRVQEIVKHKEIFTR